MSQTYSFFGSSLIHVTLVLSALAINIQIPESIEKIEFEVISSPATSPVIAQDSIAASEPTGPIKVKVEQAPQSKSKSAKPVSALPIQNSARDAAPNESAALAEATPFSPESLDADLDEAEHQDRIDADDQLLNAHSLTDADTEIAESEALAQEIRAEQAQENAEISSRIEADKARARETLKALAASKAQSRQSEIQARQKIEQEQRAKSAELAQKAALAAANQRYELARNSAIQAAEQDAEAMMAADRANSGNEQSGVGPSQEFKTTDSVGISTSGASAQGPISASQIRNLEDLRQMPGNAKPEYESEDRLMGRQGMVVFLAFVSKEGSPTSFKISQSSGHRSLDLKTLKAVKSWRFYPGQEGWVEIPFQWDLKGGPKQVGGTLRKKISQK